MLLIGFENNELNMMELNECLKEFNNNYVVKNNGLAGGKGVKLTDEHLKNSGDTIRFVNEITSNGNSFIIEEKLNGKEFSVISFTDGENLLHCPTVQDYKEHSMVILDRILEEWGRLQIWISLKIENIGKRVQLMNVVGALKKN